MANICLPKEVKQTFLRALKDGTIDPQKLSEATSAERHANFAKIVGEGNAKEVNALFESKLLLKNQQQGIINWAKSVGGLKPEVMKDLVSRVTKLEKVLSPEEQSKFLADLAAKKLGTEVSIDEATKITQLAKAAQEEKAKSTSALSGFSDEYLKAANTMRDYIDSLKPISPYASIGKNAAIIARNNLLLNPATPVKTTIGQIINSGIDLVTRRIGNLSAKGLNYDLVRQANKEAYSTYLKTGDNIATMESVDDIGRLGEGKRFDVPKGMQTGGKTIGAIESAVRNIAKVSNKVAIDWEHNIAFTKFYQKAFFDMNNVFTSKIASSEGLTGIAAKTRAAEIFRDASRVKPQTDIGAMVRSESQKQAARVTSINDTYTARLALGVKDALNKSVNGLGDALMPIAKIPANIIANGIENAGVGIPLGAKDIIQGRMLMQSEDLATRYKGMAQFSGGIQKIARTVGVMSAAAYFASQLTSKDFKSDPYGNHFVKIGNLWVNMEYVNAISPALAGFMNIKQTAKPNQGIGESVGQYTAGALQGLKSAPGIDEVSSLVNSITNSNYVKGIKKYASQFFTSRGEPAFIPNLLNSRPIDRLFFGAHGVETTQQVSDDATAAAQAKKK